MVENTRQLDSELSTKSDVKQFEIILPFKKVIMNEFKNNGSGRVSNNEIVIHNFSLIKTQNIEVSTMNHSIHFKLQNTSAKSAQT